jgi:hypothetical protein
MAGITTAMLASYKRDLLSGLHCFNQSRTFTATGVSTQTWTAFRRWSALRSATFVVRHQRRGRHRDCRHPVLDLDHGVEGLDRRDRHRHHPVGDTFKMALFKVGVAGTYSAASTNYTDMTGNSDETSGTGYTAGGTALTNVDPVASSPSAYTDFSPNPSWTSASFSTIGCMIYNTIRNGPTATLGCSVHDFGGTQTVASGTFTALMPVAAVGTAILQIT